MWATWSSSLGSPPAVLPLQRAVPRPDRKQSVYDALLCVTCCRDVSSKGSCSRGASCAFRQDDQTKKVRSARPVRQKDSRLRIPKTFVSQAESTSGKEGSPPCCLFHKEDNAGQVRIAPSPTSWSPKRWSKSYRKDSMIAKDKAGDNSLQRRGLEKIRAEGNLRSGMCAAAFFFWSQNIHCSMTTKILVLDMFFRCDTKKQRKLHNLTDVVFCATRRKKRDRAPRWRWVVDGFFK